MRARNWWLLGDPQKAMRAAVSSLPRYIGTPRIAKHRLFVWFGSEILPTDQVVVFARADDYFFGVLHSRLHSVWALRMGTRLETRPRYTPTTCFETFPFPQPTSAQQHAIDGAAKDLNALRERWLNPPEWTQEETLLFTGTAIGPWQRSLDPASVDSDTGMGRVRYPRRVPLDADCAKKLAKRTLTNLYNERPTWLDLAHKKLDAAVFAAYGWAPDMTDEAILEALLGLNAERAAAGKPVSLSSCSD